MSQGKLLIVDDLASTRRIYRAILEHAGYQVCEAVDHDQAIALVDTSVDLALVDINLGGKSGIEVLKFIRHHHPDCPVIMVSAYADKRNVIDALREGATDYLEKPVDPDELPHVVQRWLSYRFLKQENARLQDYKAMYEALRESESRLRLSQAVGGIATWEADLANNRQVWSENCISLLGFPAASEPTWEDFLALVHPEDRQRVIDATRSHIDEGTKYDVEFRVVLANGNLRWMRFAGHVVRDEDGKPIQMRGIGQDITERKLMEERLTDSEARFRALMEQSPLSIQIFAPDGSTRSVNRAWEDMWGVTLDALAQYNVLRDKQLIAMGVMPSIKKAFAGDAMEVPPVLYDLDATEEVRGIKKKIWVRAHIYPLKNAAGDLREVAVIHEDVTGRKLAELKLQQSEERNRALMQSASDAIFIADAETGILIDANKSAESLIGRHLEEIIGMHQSKLHPEDETGNYSKLFRHHVESGGGMVAEPVYVQHRDGSRIPVEISSGFSDVGGKRVLIGIFRNITKRKHAEEMLKQSEQRFRQLAENINAVFWVCSSDWNQIFYISPAYETIWGRSCQSLYEKPRSWLEHVAGDDRAKIRAEIIKKSEGDLSNPEFPEYRIVRPDGSMRWVRARAFPVRNEAGEVYRIAGIAEDITEQKLATTKLQQSQAQHEEAQRITHLGHWQLDLATNQLTWSNESFRIFGVDPEQFCASYEAFLDAVHPDDRALVNKAYTESVQNKTPYDIEHRLLMPDGSIKWVNERGQTEYAEDGTALRSTGTVLDITGRKQAMNALLELVEGTAPAASSEDFFRALTMHLSRALGVRYAFVVEDFPEMAMGRTLASWNGEGYMENFDYPLAGTPCENILSRGVCFYPRKLTSLFPTDTMLEKMGAESYMGIPFINADNQVIGHIAVMDTKPMIEGEQPLALLKIFAARASSELQRMHAKQHLLAYQSELEQVVQLSKELSVFRSEQAIYQRLCDAATGIFKLRLSWIGRIEKEHFDIRPIAGSGPCRDYLEQITVRRDDSPQGNGPSGKAAKTGVPQVQNDIEGNPVYSPWWGEATRQGFRSSIAVPLVCAKNKALAVMNLYSDEKDFFNSDRSALLMTLAMNVATNIENFRLVEGLGREVGERTSELHQAMKKAQEANRAKSAFLANMSHELRTPLNAIIGFSELMHEGLSGKLSGEQQQHVKDIFDSGQHLLSLINEMLDLSKIEADSMQLDIHELHPSSIVETIQMMHNEKARKHHIELSSHIDEDIGTIQADERKIKQVLLNLVSNAVKFTPDGGKVSIKVRERGGYVEFSVTDTGIGIKQEDFPRLFQPFQQLEAPLTKAHEGTGLGLALCKKLVEMHGGHIDLVSEPGKGSTFSFSLPREAKAKRIVDAATRILAWEHVLEHIGFIRAYHDRGNLKFGLMRIKPVSDGKAHDDIVLAAALKDIVRHHEVFGHGKAPGNYYALLMDTDHAKMEEARNRFRAVLSRLGLEADLAAAVYPDDGNDLQALLALLEKDSRVD